MIRSVISSSRRLFYGGPCQTFKAYEFLQNAAPNWRASGQAEGPIRTSTVHGMELPSNCLLVETLGISAKLDLFFFGRCANLWMPVLSICGHLQA